ncbi:hypothetical protein ACP70R_037116 [Stipagrostis hirtigluma subsp. patula]
MLDSLALLLSSLARRLLPCRRRKSITPGAFAGRWPIFSCGSDHDVSVGAFLKPEKLRKLKDAAQRPWSKRIGERKRGKDDGGDDMDGDEPCVWRRTILLGRRCQPLQFTGAIHYDSEGQRLWQPRTPPRSPLLSPIHYSTELGYMDMDRA